MSPKTKEENRTRSELGGSEAPAASGMCVVLLPLCALLLSVVAEEARQTAAPQPAVTANTITTTTSGSSGNGTQGGGVSGATAHGGDGVLAVDSSMIQRALYVLIAITMIGVLYFLIRAVR